MKKLAVITILLTLTIWSQAQVIDGEQITADSLKQAQIEALKEAVYNANVQSVVQTMMLAYGTVEVDKDTLQTMISRDQNGDYYIHLSAYTFKIPEARMIISIPNENREIMKAIDYNLGVIELNKFQNEKETRIMGKPMPNYKIEIK